jgi:hypothetical protein
MYFLIDSLVCLRKYCMPELLEASDTYSSQAISIWLRLVTFISTTLATAAAALTLSENVYHNFINAIRSEATIVIVYAVIKNYNITLTANCNRCNNERSSRTIYWLYRNCNPKHCTGLFWRFQECKVTNTEWERLCIGVALGNIQNAFWQPLFLRKQDIQAQRS